VPSAPAAEESKETPQSKKPVKKIPKVTICVNLKTAAKKCGKKFACGSSIVKGANEDHIEVQGEVEVEIITFLAKEFSIPEEAFKIVEAKGKGKHAAKK